MLIYLRVWRPANSIGPDTVCGQRVSMHRWIALFAACTHTRNTVDTQARSSLALNTPPCAYRVCINVGAGPPRALRIRIFLLLAGTMEQILTRSFHTESLSNLRERDSSRIQPRRSPMLSDAWTAAPTIFQGICFPSDSHFIHNCIGCCPASLRPKRFRHRVDENFAPTSASRTRHARIPHRLYEIGAEIPVLFANCRHLFIPARLDDACNSPMSESAVSFESLQPHNAECKSILSL